MSSNTSAPDNRSEFARVARPTRKHDALLLALSRSVMPL
jgi:hypothetical protein